MKEKILALIDWFIPEGMSQYNQSEVLLRARILVVYLLGAIAMTASLYVSILIFSNYRNHAIYIGGAFCSMCIIFFFIGLNLFKHTGSFGLTGNLLTATLFFGSAGAIFFTGGFYDSPTLLLVLTIPGVAFVLAGAQSGLVWSGIVFVNALGFFLLYKAGVQFSTTLTLAEAKDLYFCMYSTVLLFHALSLYTSYLIQQHMTIRFYREQSQLTYNAAHDPITGLANRTTYEKRLNECIDLVILNDSEAAVTLIDILNIKQICESYAEKFSANDTESFSVNHGQNLYDAILQEVAKRLDNCSRQTDTKARLSDSQFAIISPNLRSTNSVEELLNNLHDALKQPIILRDNEIHLQVISGTAICPHHGDDSVTLHNQAAQAVLQGKETNNHRFICQLDNV